MPCQKARAKAVYLAHEPPLIARIFHAHHGISRETLEWALSEICPIGFFLRTLTLTEEHPDLSNALYGPKSGDAPIAEDDVHRVKRTGDRPPSRMVARPRRATRLLTVIGMAEGESVTIYTAYGGPAAEREPGDPTVTPGSHEHEVAVTFWAEHALASEPWALTGP